MLEKYLELKQMDELYKEARKNERYKKCHLEDGNFYNSEDTHSKGKED